MENPEPHEMVLVPPNISLAFERLRPLCVRLTKEHCIANVTQVKEQLDKLSPDELQHLQLYVLFPFRIILKQPNLRNENLLIAVFECVGVILSQTTLSSWPLFLDFFASFCDILHPLPSHTNPDGVAAQLPEELQLEILRCLNLLVKKSDESVLNNLYQSDMLPALGHAFTTVLRILEHEHLRQLRLEAISCMESLAQLNTKGPKSFLTKVGSMIASSFPGMSMTLVKVISFDLKKGHLVASAALSAWSKLLQLILGDRYLEVTVKQVPSIGKQSTRYQELIVQRTEDWLKVTASKVKVLVEKVITMVTHDNWKVRLTLAQWAQAMLTKCEKSLSCCLSSFLEVLVTLVGDEYGNVASFSQRALEAYQESHIAETVEGSRTLVEVLQENLYKMATRLPRLIRTSNEETQLSTLNLFHGYLHLLGPQMDSLLRSQCHMSRVAMAMIQILELDCGYIKVIAEKSTGNPMIELDSAGYYGHRPRKYFKHFTDDKIYQRVCDICHELGRHGDLDLLVDCFLELFHQGELYRKEAALCINEILLGTLGKDGKCTARDTGQVNSIVRTLVDEYVASENFDITISNQPEMLLQTELGHDWQIALTNQQQASKSVQRLNSNILQVCILMEGIANSAQVEGERFRLLLIKVIYPLLDKLGCPTAMVSHTAYITLHQVAAACKYSGIEELISENCDYLVNTLSLRLRHLEQHPRSPEVLKIVLQNSSADILHLVKDSILEIMESLDDHHDSAAILFMRVLFVLVNSINVWFPCLPTNTNKQYQDIATEIETLNLTDHHETKKKTSLEKIQEFFSNYHKQKQLAEGNFNDGIELGDGNIEDGSTSPNELEEKKEFPMHVKMVEMVLERCAHLMAAPDARLRLLVLRTVKESLLALANYEDVVLPHVHKLWAPLVHRFSDEEPLVTVEALKSLRVMGDVSGDFIHQRTVKDILPKLCASLSKQATVSKRAGPAYRFGVHYKLQRAALKNIGPICEKVDLQEGKLQQVLKACIPYLSVCQPDILRKDCLEAFQYFIKKDADVVWLMLYAVYQVAPLIPPHSTLPDIKVPGSKTRNEYSTNIEIIMKYMTSCIS